MKPNTLHIADAHKRIQKAECKEFATCSHRTREAEPFWLLGDGGLSSLALLWQGDMSLETFAPFSEELGSATLPDVEFPDSNACELPSTASNEPSVDASPVHKLD